MKEYPEAPPGQYEAKRNWNMTTSAGSYHILKGNITKYPNDHVSQEQLNKLAAGANPVLVKWTPPEEFKDKV